MKIFKNAEIKLQAQELSEKVKASNARRKGLAFKGTRNESSYNESESQDEDEDVGLVQEDLSWKKRNSTREDPNRSLFLEKKFCLLLVLNATNRDT